MSPNPALKLLIDLGNTLAKLALFKGEELLHFSTLEAISLEKLQVFLQQHPDVKSVLLSSVINHPPDIIPYLRQRYHFIELNERTPLPIENLYHTPDTLGKDRIAAAVGANHRFKDQAVLVVDAGTCIKYNFVTAKNQFMGGGISPGLNMRFKALHSFTEQLPLLDIQQLDQLIGMDTTSSIVSGVQNGALAEVDGIINAYRKQYPDLKTVLTGGDLNFFDKALKNSIFADPFLVLKGLNIILDTNVK